MPQLDKMNWFFILTLLVLCISIFLVIFIKRNFYSWRKVVLLKVLTKFNFTEGQQNKALFPFLTLNGNFLQLRKTLFNNLSLNKTNFFLDTLKNFENSLQKK